MLVKSDKEGKCSVVLGRPEILCLEKAAAILRGLSSIHREAADGPLSKAAGVILDVAVEHAKPV